MIIEVSVRKANNFIYRALNILVSGNNLNKLGSNQRKNPSEAGNLWLTREHHWLDFHGNRFPELVNQVAPSSGFLNQYEGSIVPACELPYLVEQSAEGARFGIGIDKNVDIIANSIFADWAAVDPAGEAAASDAVAGVLFDPLGTASDGAAGIRPAFPLVRRYRR